MANGPSEHPTPAPQRPKGKGSANLVDRWSEKMSGGLSRRDVLISELRAGRTARERTQDGRDLRGLSLRGESLKGVDLSRCDLTGADLREADLTGARMVNALMVDASLHEADLTRVDLRRANLDAAVLDGANLEHADLEGASLKGASLVEASLELASLRQADLQDANLTQATLRSTKLNEATLSGINGFRACFSDADLTLTEVQGASFARADLRGAHFRGMRSYRKASFLKADIRDVHFGGAYGLRRHIIDEDYLEEFRRRSPVHGALYGLWWLTSDCGRSLARWTAWALVTVFAFGWAFEAGGVPFGDAATSLSPYLFSTQAFTSLGLIELDRLTVSMQALVIAEAFIGLLFFAGAIGIMVQGMSRRGD